MTAMLALRDRDRPGRDRGLHNNVRSSRSYLGDLRWRNLVAVGPIRSDAVVPWRAARVALGVVVPLAIGSASGHLDYGAFAAARLARDYRRLLDRYGFTQAAVQLTEWNYGLVDQPSAMQRAAYIADSLILMQDSPLRRLLLPGQRPGHEQFRADQRRRHAYEAWRGLRSGRKHEHHAAALGHDGR
jgi:hypothetical protein